MIEKLQHALQNGGGTLGIAFRTQTGRDWEIGVLVGVDAGGIALHPQSPKDDFIVIPWHNITQIVVKK